MINEFKLSSRIKIFKAELDPCLPSEFSPDEWWKLAPWSNLKRPKKWMHNRRLKKKICKYPQRYLPIWIWDRFLTIGEKQVQDAYATATKDILREEDNRLKSLLNT